MPWRLEGVLHSLTVVTENQEDSIVAVRYASEDVKQVAESDSAFASPVGSTLATGEVQVNDILLEAFRHSAWATRKLVAACRQLSIEQLQEPGPGFGSLLATLNHIVECDAAYATIIWDEHPRWDATTQNTEDLGEIEARVEECLHLWRGLLEAPLDGERLLILDKGQYECPVSIVVAQALHHASAHREQIRARLADCGVPAPDLQSWAYAGDTGRARQIEKSD